MGRKKDISTASEVPVCRKGHPLKFEVANDDYVCDVCASDVCCGAGFYGCHPCDYSVCTSCHSHQEQAIGIGSAPEMESGEREEIARRRKEPADSKLAKMNDQNSMRDLLHDAIAKRSSKEVQAVLILAQGVLSPEELHLALSDLVAIREEEMQQQAAIREQQESNEEEQASIARRLAESTSIDQIEYALELARGFERPELLKPHFEDARERLNKLRTAAAEDARRNDEALLWREAQEAIREDNAERLLNILGTRGHLLSAEKCLEAQRKLPGMQVRSQIRRDLKLAFRSTNDLLMIRQVVDGARRSCLPRGEVALAEATLKKLEEQVKLEKAKAKAATEDTPVDIPPAPEVPAEPEIFAQPEMNAPRSNLQEFLHSQWGVKFQEALRSGDAEEQRLAIEDARITGIPTKDISRLQAYVLSNASGYGRSTRNARLE